MKIKKKRGPRKNGKPWPNNIGAWIAGLSTEQRTQLVKRATRAQWGPEKVAPKKADDGPWTWPVDLNHYDRSSALTAVEEDMLTRYEEAYRFYRYGRHMDSGPELDRLVRPLNDALDYIGIRTLHRRYTLQFLLREMAERQRSFWGWTTDEWIESIHRRTLAHWRQKRFPALCKKAGVPTADVRGNITSHRGRSTIASQFYNGRDPMTLFELQQWLGHSTPAAAQHYAKITPLKLSKAYADAGYFARNLRAIEVMVDQDLVRSGRAATEPWKFYDLGHGYCTYDFFEQCQHRMACAKCDFYMPKESTAALLLEGKTHLLRLLQEIPLGDAEQAAIEDGVTAYENLLSKLADVPTPAGPTPRQIGAELVQITSVRQTVMPLQGNWERTSRISGNSIPL